MRYSVAQDIRRKPGSGIWRYAASAIKPLGDDTAWSRVFRGSPECYAARFRAIYENPARTAAKNP
jgi:hypothetical protein